MNQILSVADIAEEMGTKPHFVRKLIKQGHLRKQRGCGRFWKVSRIELDRYYREGVSYA